MSRHPTMMMIFAAVGFAALTGGCEGESSVCVPGGACEDMALRQCSCCLTAAEQATCENGVIDGCASGQLSLSASAASCAETNAAWDQHVDGGSEPCESMNRTEEELVEFCKGPQPAGGAPEDPPPEGS